MTDVVIVSAARTAVGKFGGSLAKIAAPDLGAAVIRAVLERAGPETGAGQRSDPRPGVDRRLRPEPGAPVADQGGLARGRARHDDQQGVRLGPEGRDAGGQRDHRGRCGHRDRRRPGKHERGAARAAGLARRFPHGRREADRLDDRRRPVGRVQPVPHGRDGGKRREGIRHHARSSRTRSRRCRRTRRKPRRSRAVSTTKSCRSKSRNARASRCVSPPTSSCAMA